MQTKVYVHAVLQGIATALTSFTATVMAMALATQSSPHAGLAMVAAFTGSIAAGLMSGLNYLNTSAGEDPANQPTLSTSTQTVYLPSPAPTVNGVEPVPTPAAIVTPVPPITVTVPNAVSGIVGSAIQGVNV